MPESQSLKNHGRTDPLYHFFIAPLSLINIIYSIVHTVKHWPEQSDLHLWWIAMSFLLFAVIWRVRTYPLKAQDRIIRLEERLRLASLLPPTEYAKCAALTEQQLIGLRFASDAELPALVNRALKESLGPTEIKKAIQDWRGDHFRV